MIHLKRFFHIVKKILCFVLFGLGGIILTFLVFPPILLFFRNQEKQERVLRKVIQLSFASFTRLMVITGVLNIDLHGFEELRTAESKIICANHPTLLDVVFLIGNVKNANCIVKSELWKNPFVKGVISRIYIPNSLGSEEMLKECGLSLEKGHNIILFPESSRTIKDKPLKFHRSASHLALASGYDILPVHIDVVWPSGLGKEDKLLSSPDNGIIDFVLSVREVLTISKYEKMERPIAARQLTNELMFIIFARESL